MATPKPKTVEYAADFETTTKEDDCRVWAWCLINLKDPDYGEIIGTKLEDFIEFMIEHRGKYYFHNLKFDGGFIVDWLLRNGYTWKATNKLNDKEFTTLISSMGQWYSIQIQLPTGNSGLKKSITIVDSLKFIPMPIKAMPKTFGFTDESKGEIDYTAERGPNHQLTAEERDYIIRDTRILAKAINFMHNAGMTKMTTASNALASYKAMIDKKQYEQMFPKLSPVEDYDMRKAYKGGFTYLNPKFAEKEIGKGRVYDVNSMYPWTMVDKDLPYGEPVWYNGEYKPNKYYPLYICAILCEFKLKPGMIPTIQIKHHVSYSDNEYLSQSIEPVYLYLTSVDYELFVDHYDVTVHEFIGGYMFHARKGIFADYIDYWYGVKTQSRIDGNTGNEKIAKLMLNSLYGKFGTNPKGRSKIPYFSEEKNKVCYEIGPEEDRNTTYLPIACFITAWARDRIIRSAQLCGERFVYADTDSLHIIGDEEPPIDIDNKRLGAFKLESTFEKAKFVRQKTYLEMIEGELNVKCAGMPANIKDKVTFENFEPGAKFTGKLMPQVVPGGVILKETTFEIKKAKGVDKYIPGMI